EADLIRPVRDDELRQDEFWSLRDVSFQVRRGECLGLIGHNGAGKSTLLKILTGLIRPDRGRITMRGRVGAMIELGAGFNPILTGRENIFNQAAMLGFSPDEVRRKFDAIVDFSEIEHAIDMPLQNYSSGMKIRLGFSVFAQLEPDVLLIDEVLAVGDVGFRMKSLNKMSELMNRCAVIFVTHAMPQVFRVCSEVMLLRHGAVMYQGRDVAAGVAKYFDEF
ncbi:MAG: ABC transporter ATP-binding protein, partial [Planctomycetaceae bacterium]